MEKLLDMNKETSKYETMHVLYNIILLIVAIIGVPYYLLKMIFTGKYRKSLISKLGGHLPALPASKKGPRVWIHAVSVGEVTAAAPIVHALSQMRPDVEVIFSVSTETGREMAERLVKNVAATIYFPLDFPFIVSRIINQVKADVFAMVETELWPNFLRACRNGNIKALIVNGRISPRSFRKYKLTGFFWRDILNNLSSAGMIAEVDAKRIRSIGMSLHKIQVLGNAKYDSLAAMAAPELHDDITRFLSVQKDEKFLVAGSTHRGEEETIVEVYRELIKFYDDLNLIIVPRHIERVGSVLELLERNGLRDVIVVSEIRQGKKRRGERIILVDVIGELFKIYSLATVVFCGGSLVPKGGQNILEPAAWGKVIFYGPSMEDFSEERILLEKAGAGTTVRNAEELRQGIIRVLDNSAQRHQLGAQGRAVVVTNMGAASRYAALIVENLP